MTDNLRESEVLSGQGAIVKEASRKIGITDQTCYLWRKEYGAMRIEQARRFGELEKPHTMQDFWGLRSNQRVMEEMNSTCYKYDIALRYFRAFMSVFRDMREILVQSRDGVILELPGYRNKL